MLVGGAARSVDTRVILPFLLGRSERIGGR
jgi:hypothetical protein